MNENEQEFNKVMSYLISQNNIAGASWSFVSDNGIDYYYDGYLGFIDEYKEMKLNEEAIYDIASLTKIIGTTTRILQLIDLNLLQLNTKVSDILPRYQNLNCTIKQLITHTSGLPADFSDKSNFNWDTVILFLESLSLYSIEDEMIYSDIGYIILGLVIEKIDKCNLDESFKKNIFSKLNMMSTSYNVINEYYVVPTEIKNNAIVVSTVHDSKAHQLDRPIGSAGLFSSLHDISLFANAIIKNQFHDGTPLFSENIYKLLQNTTCNNRSLGWEWLDNTHKVLFHTGFTGTSIGIDIYKKKALVLLTNRIHPSRDNTYFISERKLAYKKYFNNC